MEVNCGQCLGCRLDYSRMWAMRIVHESSLHESGNGNSFVTLTYSDDHIPDDWSLHVEDFQKFMKRLRKRSEDRVRFFHVGEYGDRCRHGVSVSECDGCSVGRPHYHAILFNRRFDDAKLFSRREDIELYSSQELEDTWQKGFCTVGEVTMQSAGYVARYCLKKVTGSLSDEWYRNTDEDGVVHQVKREYATMSRRPGIGREWFEKFKADCFPSDEVPVPGHGVVAKVPRYYADVYGVECPDELEAIKLERQAFRDAHLEEYSPERLASKYKVKKAQVALLKREL